MYALLVLMRKTQSVPSASSPGLMRREAPARASFTSTSSRACKHCSTIPRASRRSCTVVSTLKVTNIQKANAMSSTVMSTTDLLERVVEVEGNKIGVKYFADKRDIALAFTPDGFCPHDNRSATCWPSILFNISGVVRVD